MKDQEIYSKVADYGKNASMYIVLSYAMGIIGVIFALKGIMDFVSHKNVIISVVIAVIAFILVKPFEKKGNQFKREKRAFIGEHVVKPAIAEMIEVSEYSTNRHIDQQIVTSCPLFPQFDRISGSDYICGQYKGVNMQYSDLTLSKKERYRTSDGKHRTTYVAEFKGQFLRLPMNSRIDGYVKIIENDPLQKPTDAEAKENKVQMESAAFNQQFTVYTDNDELAFYILTPQFMESVVEADQFAKGRTSIYFNKTYVDIAIHTAQDAFEVYNMAGNQNGLDKARQRIQNDMKKVLSIVDQILEKDKLF